MQKEERQKLIAIVGTTASGKTSLAVDLAHRLNGEIVSADSRQVYRYMDIGSGKDLAEYDLLTENGDTIHVPYHLIDVADPNEEYDLAKWLLGAKTAVSDIASRSRLAIIAGGTGLFVQALLDGYKLSEQGSDPELRKELEALNLESLLDRLFILDKVFVQSLNNSERNNIRRLIRHIEILESFKKGKKSQPSIEKIRPYDDLIIGLFWPREVLRKRIYDRIIKRLDEEGMLAEVEYLHNERGLSWSRLESFGLEYRYLARHLQGKLTYEEMITKLHVDTCRFAKRQMTWLRRWEKQGAKIHWLESLEEAYELSTSFLKKQI
jgi:tRNA dimethylallyltransferase